MKIYIAGKITGDPCYKEKFEKVKLALEDKGHKVMNPAVLPSGFEHHEYMKICFSMIDVCEAVYFLEDWHTSKGAKLEFTYADNQNKLVLFKPNLLEELIQ